MGYAFVNFLSPSIVQRFFIKYQGKKLTKASEKTCQLRYANQ
jgi:hypothetical protein